MIEVAQVGTCFASQHMYSRVQRVTVFANPLAISDEQRAPILVCSGVRKPLGQLWQQIKSYE